MMQLLTPAEPVEQLDPDRILFSFKGKSICNNLAF